MRSLLIPAVVLASSLSVASPAILAQDSVEKSPPPQLAGQLSPVLRSERYPELIYPHALVPAWDRGYMVHHEIEASASPKRRT